MVKGKRNGLTFTECSVKICRKKVYSAAFTAILKLKLPQCNAIEVRTPPGLFLTSEACRENKCLAPRERVKFVSPRSRIFASV